MPVLEKIEPRRLDLPSTYSRPVEDRATYMALAYLILENPSARTRAAHIGFFFEERHTTCTILHGAYAAVLPTPVLREVGHLQRVQLTAETIKRSIDGLIATFMASNSALDVGRKVSKDESVFAPYVHLHEIRPIADRTCMHQYAEKLISLCVQGSDALRTRLTYLDLSPLGDL